MAENAVVFSNTYKTPYSITDQTKYMYYTLSIVLESSQVNSFL